MSSLKPGATVLVTGADGFIGSHLTETLVRQGYKVRAFVLYNSFNSWGWLDHCGPDIKGQFEVFAGDVRDPHGVREAMKGCDAVLHLAALIAIPYSYTSPDTYIDTNVKGTLNILQATLLAMRRAVAKLPRTPDHALVDGNQPPPLACPVRCVVGGDGLSFSIAGASIIAKVLRDRAMRRLDPRWPAYGFARHAGYPTAAHREALARLGPSPHHRRGFGPVDQAVLNLT